MTILSTAAFILILLSAVIQGIFIMRKGGTGTDPASHFILLLSAALLLTVTVVRSVRIGFVALTGTYESLVFYGAVTACMAAAYRLQKRLPFRPLVQFGITVIIAAMLAIASSPIAPKEVQPPIPALKSYWLALHVAFSFVGEAFFIASFVAALAFLLTRDADKRAGYDRLTYTAIALGYPVFTAGALVFGAVWAEKAWGAWWSWDPKETWALVTWLVYTAYLHSRFIRKKNDALPSLIAVIGFLCTLFTFFGVNFLLSGLHSYG